MEPTGGVSDATPETSADLGEPETGPIPSAPPAAGAGPDVTPLPTRRHTRLSAAWTGVVAALVILIVLIVFIAENTQHSTVTFFGLHGSAPVSVLLLIAAVAGALIVVVVGAARLLQLRLADRRARAVVGAGTRAGVGEVPRPDRPAVQPPSSDRPDLDA